MRYGSVAAMVNWLDRAEIAAAKRMRVKKAMRRIKNPSFRRFVSALRYEVEHDPEYHEWNIREKVCSRLKIGARMYEMRLKSFR